MEKTKAIRTSVQEQFSPHTRLVQYNPFDVSRTWEANARFRQKAHFWKVTARLNMKLARGVEIGTAEVAQESPSSFNLQLPISGPSGASSCRCHRNETVQLWDADNPVSNRRHL